MIVRGGVAIVWQPYPSVYNTGCETRPKVITESPSAKRTNMRMSPLIIITFEHPADEGEL